MRLPREVVRTVQAMCGAYAYLPQGLKTPLEKGLADITEDIQSDRCKSLVSRWMLLNVSNKRKYPISRMPLNEMGMTVISFKRRKYEFVEAAAAYYKLT